MSNFFSKLFKKKCDNPEKMQLKDAQKRYNRIWDMWVDGELSDEMSALCEYESGVNGEGHLGFFDNNRDKLDKIAEGLKNILPDDLYANFDKALKEYQADPDSCDDFEDADEFFYDNEQRIIDIMQDYADKNVVL